MWPFSKKKRLERRLKKNSALLAALLELNSKTEIDLSYSHSLALLRMIANKDEALKISEEASLAYAKENAAEPIEKKKRNIVRWSEYQNQLSVLLERHPLSSNEAERCRVAFPEYQELVTGLMAKLVLKPDTEPLIAVVKYCGRDSLVVYRTIDFHEAQLLQDESTAVPVVKLDEPTASDQNTSSALVPEAEVQVVPINGSDASADEPKIIERGSLVDRRKSIRERFDSDPELKKIRESYEPDDAFPGLIAKELVFAKEKMD